MALRSAQSVLQAGTTPTAYTPAASDTIAVSDFGPNGAFLRVITTGTATTVSVQDPNTTALGNPGTVTGVVAPSTGVRMILIPSSAVSSSTGLATVLFSGALTGVTAELYRA